MMTKLLYFFYDIGYVFFAVGYIPYSIVKRKFHRGLWQRLTANVRVSGMPNGDGTWWVHAVSVGEVAAMRGFLSRCRREHPDRRIVLTTVTATGNYLARKLKGEVVDEVFYLPLDISLIVRKFVDRIRPDVFIAAETEIWPNVMRILNERNVPIIIMNGRLSDRSFTLYRRGRSLFKHVVGRVGLVCTQSVIDRERFCALGCDPQKVLVTGNIKFDLEAAQGISSQTETVHKELALGPEHIIFVCGSTHEGEEEYVYAAYQRLRAQYPRLVLIMVPRHPERAGRVERLASTYGLSALCLSRIREQNAVSLFVYNEQVIIVDTIGELLALYRMADIVFVGGSIVPAGGHNPIEPALFAKPIICGPYMNNFRDIERVFTEGKAVCRIMDASGLYAAIDQMISDQEYAGALGKRARQVVAEHRGAIERTKKEIEDFLNRR